MGALFFSVLAKIHRPVMETVWVLLGKFRENRKKRWRKHGEDISATLGSFTILFRSDKSIKRFHWEENIFLTCDLRFSHELRGRKSPKEMIPGVTANDSVFHPPVKTGSRCSECRMVVSGQHLHGYSSPMVQKHWPRLDETFSIRLWKQVSANQKRSATTWCRSFFNRICNQSTELHWICTP